MPPEPTDHLDLIAKLLAKAERTDHPAEAETFMARAQTLAARHSIDLAVARSHSAKSEAREAITEVTIVTGKPGTRGLAQYVRLLAGVSFANDLRPFISHDQSKVFLIGFPSDIEVVTALYGSLVIQMVRASESYLRSDERRNTVVTVWSERHRGYIKRPLHGSTARRDFMQGYAERIGERLRLARVEAEEAATAAEQAGRSAAGELSGPHTGSTSRDSRSSRSLVTTAIALREKARELDSYVTAYQKRMRIRGTWRVDRTRDGRHAGSWAAGTDAAERAHLGDAPRGIGG